MISFNTKDFNILRIKRESKLGNLETRYKYRVYGLRNEGNAPILVSVDEDYISADWFSLIRFFKLNNILLSVDYENHESDDKDKGLVSIGLRKDLREQPVLAAAILQAIVYHAEKRLVFKDFSVPGIPKFEINTDSVPNT
jgi:hypothetical protein